MDRVVEWHSSLQEMLEDRSLKGMIEDKPLETTEDRLPKEKDSRNTKSIRCKERTALQVPPDIR